MSAVFVFMEFDKKGPPYSEFRVPLLSPVSHLHPGLQAAAAGSRATWSGLDESPQGTFGVSGFGPKVFGLRDVEGLGHLGLKFVVVFYFHPGT